MAASGLVPRRPDHATAALRFALDMLATAAVVDLGDGLHVELRVGLHAGPVTAGLIGRTRARYCLFGGASRHRRCCAGSAKTTMGGSSHAHATTYLGAASIRCPAHTQML
jgi:class 3 adenylate cyclase